MISIFVAKSAVEAQLIIQMLDNNGIYAIKEDIGGAGFMELYGTSSMYGQNILVNEEDYEKAKDLVDAFFGR